MEEKEEEEEEEELTCGPTSPRVGVGSRGCWSRNSQLEEST